MNQNKVAFIICTNNKLYYDECVYYLSKLNIPEGIEVDVVAIEQAEYMTKAYNEAMNASDAKYKVYLHHDVFIVNADFIQDILTIFRNPEVGMIGLAGSSNLKEFFANEYWWNKGECYANSVTVAHQLVFGKVVGEYETVQAIDGMLMVTQYDYPWREDRYKGWDFYDFSQSMVFLEHGKQIVVPNQKTPWIMHDHGFLEYSNYNQWKQLFLEEYPQFGS